MIDSLKKWRQFPKVLDRREKIFFLFSSLLVLSAIVLFTVGGVGQFTEIRPQTGGMLKEGLVGQPRFVNPVLATSDVDRDLTQLTFSGLMRYDNKGNVIPDLAQEVKVGKDGEYYDVTLKEDVFWSDGEKITSSDIVFTIETIQNPSYKSPERVSWLGVKIESLNDRKVRFRLEKPYYPFPEKLTIKIIPEHIFGEMSAQEFPFSPHNLEKVVSSGPFLIDEIKRNEEGRILNISLKKNEKHHKGRPYLEEIYISFFENNETLYRSFSRNKLDTVLVSDSNKTQDLNKRSVTLHSSESPRYFAVFFNQQRELFQEKEIREALSLAINKEDVINKGVSRNAQRVDSPILSEVFDLPAPKEREEKEIDELLKEVGLTKSNGWWVKDLQDFSKNLEKGDESSQVKSLQECLARDEEIYPEGETTGYFGVKTEEAVVRFQEKYREDILEPWGFEEGTGLVSETTREKLNEICFDGEEHLALNLITLDQEFLVNTAQELARQWKELGVDIKIQSYPIEKLREKGVSERDYDLFLFGEMLGAIPDPYPFWHSSGKESPGLNLSSYDNDEADTYLERARRATDEEDFQTNLSKFQNQFQKDLPALLLYSPKIDYLASDKIKGLKTGIIIDPSQRFWNVDEWFIKEKRTIK